MFIFFNKLRGKLGKVVHVLIGEMYATSGKYNFPGAKQLRCPLDVLDGEKTSGGAAQFN